MWDKYIEQASETTEQLWGKCILLWQKISDRWVEKSSEQLELEII